MGDGIEPNRGYRLCSDLYSGSSNRSIKVHAPETASLELTDVVSNNLAICFDVTSTDRIDSLL